MEMNLKLVTFDKDQEQFLVNAAKDETAIELAIEANKKIGDYDNPDWNEQMNDKSNYDVEDVDFGDVRQPYTILPHSCLPP